MRNLAKLFCLLALSAIPLKAQIINSGGGSFTSLTAGTNSNVGNFNWTQAGVFTSTQNNLPYTYTNTGGNGSCVRNNSLNNTEVLSVLLCGPTSADQVATNVGVASWVFINDSSQDSVNTNPNVPGYAFRGNTTCAVAHTNCEGMFVNVQDTASTTAITLVGNEVDVSIANTGTTGYGQEYIALGTAQSTSLPAAYVNPFSATSKFTSGFYCDTGALLVSSNSAPCMVLNPQVTGNSQKSDTIQFNATNGSGTKFPLDIFTSYNASANTPILTSLQSYADIVTTVFSRNTAQTGANIALSAGWGSTATVGSVSGYAQRMRFTVTSSGTGQAANPTITITFSDAMPFAPLCMGIPQGGTGTTQANIYPGTETATSSGAMVWQGTPVAASTYIFLVDCRL